MRYVLFMIALVYFIFCLPTQLFNEPTSTIINDKDGRLLNAKIAKDGQWRFPACDSLPDRFKTCLLNFEDKRFYKHIGVDFFALAEAVKINAKSGSIKRGGSTLTMQLMRMCRKKKSRNLYNKIVEMIMALRYEITHDKDEILCLYASYAPFGSNVVGIEAASWRYFGKNIHELSWAESALLAVLPNSPSLIHLGKNRDTLLKKRNRLLLDLKKYGSISEEEYNLALLEAIPPSPLDLPSYAPHLLTSLPKIDKSKYKFNSTIDRSMHVMASEVLDRYHESYQQEGIENGAILIMETQTGNVLAYIGNTTSSNEKYVDMIMAKRSSGSTLKPFLYAAMQDAGQLTPSQLLQDIPININGFIPQNFDRKYRGAVHADDALAQSLNIPYVLALKEFGIQKFINTLNHLEINSVNKSEQHYGLSLILGGAEVNLWELCGAYAYMGRSLINFKKYEGKYNYDEVHLPRIESKEIRASKLSFKPPVLSAGAVFTTFEALSKLNRPDDEGNWQFFNNVSKIAWKTGTSFGHKDAWAIGITPKFTIGVWVGNASGEGRAGLTGTSKAAPILFDLFNKLPQSFPFETPWDDLAKTPICKLSGHVASSICTEVDTNYIAATSMPRQVCPYHKHIYTNHDKTRQVSKDCCNCEGEVTAWFEMPPSIVHFYKNYHPEYRNIPDFDKNCDELNISNSKQLDIIYPTAQAKIFIPKNISSQKENLIAKATSLKQTAKLFWHLDDQFIGITTDNHSMAMISDVGEHKLTITDETGNRIIRKFWIVN